MSGKRARSIRKMKTLPKKAIALCAGLCFSYASMAQENEVLLSLFAPFSKPLGEAHQMEYGNGAGLKVTWRPSKLLNLYAQGQYLSMEISGIDPVKVFDASLGAGCHLPVSDRFSLDVNAGGGAYTANAAGGNLSGFTAGLSVGFSYKISPVISADTQVSGMHYAAGSSPLMMVNAAIAPGVTFDITKMFNNQTKVNIQLDELSPVFPALYSWYEKNSFGKVTVLNEEDNAITDVTVSFYQPQYMAHPKECVNIRKIEKGESADVDLIAFFNEQMLELTEMTETNCAVIVNYLSLGQKKTKTFSLDVPVYGRNNMSWDDDRRAAVFVSSKDPAAMSFAKYVTSIVRENKRTWIPTNIQYAMGIFEALNQYGINYVVDPSSAFADNIGTASIDFLQFPYQTLMYKGGDCDDLSILVCSLFEAVGIRTAFITIPGHIFMAFDSGLTVSEAEEKFRSLEHYIQIEDEVWVPLEITLSDEGFYKAYKYGGREWNKAFAEGTAALYRMQDSWKIYPPISVPGAEANVAFPQGKQIASLFNQSIDYWRFIEMKDLMVLEPKTVITMKEDEIESENVPEIKEDPFAFSSLYEVLTLSGQPVAMLPTSGIQFEKKEEERDDKPNKEPEPDFDDDESDLEDLELLPTVAVNVPGPEEIGIFVPGNKNKNTYVASLSTPKNSELARVTEIKKSSEIAKASETTAEVAKPAEIAKVSEISQTPEVSMTSEISKTTEISQNAEVVKNSETSSEAAKYSEIEGNSESAKVSEISQTAVFAKLSEASQMSEKTFLSEPQTSRENSKSSEIPQISETENDVSDFSENEIPAVAITVPGLEGLGIEVPEENSGSFSNNTIVTATTENTSPNMVAKTVSDVASTVAEKTSGKERKETSEKVETSTQKAEKVSDRVETSVKPVQNSSKTEEASVKTSDIHIENNQELQVQTVETQKSDTTEPSDSKTKKIPLAPIGAAAGTGLLAGILAIIFNKKRKQKRGEK